MFLKDEDGVLYEEGAVGEHRKRRAGKRPTANSTMWNWFQATEIVFYPNVQFETQTGHTHTYERRTYTHTHTHPPQVCPWAAALNDIKRRWL